MLLRLESTFSNPQTGVFESDDLRIEVLITGVGAVATAFHLGRRLAAGLPDLALQAGVAGSYDPAIQPGSVVHVVRETFADLGIEENDGRFTDLFELGLQDPDASPFQNGHLHQPTAAQTGFLPDVNGLTLSKASGHAPTIAARRKQYPDAQVETLEGAAFFYACLLSGAPFLEIRAISNFVEPRNRDAWQLGTAIGNLNEVLGELLDSLKTPLP